jgi:(E)-4-hydroxy-3-methylbut-2-enyl-diphosphate synthase
MGDPPEPGHSATVTVQVGDVLIGGGHPVVVQSMTDTDTADAAATARQALVLARAGAELVRITVDRDEAAAAVPEIRSRLDDAGCAAPLVGDFHFNGHVLLRRHPGCAAALAKYRINPGNVGKGKRGGANFSEICALARDHDAAVRIGVNGGSLDPDLVTAAMADNAAHDRGLNSTEVLDHCMVASALQSVDAALECGLGSDRIVVSCKVSSPRSLIAIYRDLASKTRQPLHLGLTEAGMGARGLVWSASAMAVLLAEGIGDTIRMSLTPAPGGRRTDEVEAACELLQALGLRSFKPTIVACPGCGRTTSGVFQDLAERVGRHIKRRMAEGWREQRPGVENLTIAVMGCVVNGPGESRQADIGISLPGTGEEPRCPVYVDGRRVTTLHGSIDEVAERFVALIDELAASRFEGGVP